MKQEVQSPRSRRHILSPPFLAPRRFLVGICSLGLLAAGAARNSTASDSPATVEHVLLISVDGLHQSDLEWYLQHHRNSTLASLMGHAIEFSHAFTPFPSDSFPGLIGQVTGGNPATTGIFYDDTWNHAVFPAGTQNCSGPVPGGRCTYFEALDLNLGALDAGAGLVPSNDPLNPWSDILQLTGDPLQLIDPTQLPVDPTTCSPIFPNQYLKVNTVFEVAHAHHLRTAWSDKHPAYQIVSGPSGQGVDEYFTPEINSSSDPNAPTSQDAADWTKDNLNTQKYDHYKVQAVVNWINGHYHDGTGSPGTPAIFGMNFQAVSTAQKLPTSHTEGTTAKLAGGYEADGATPGPVLQNALDFIDGSLSTFLDALGAQQLADHSTLLDHTAIIVSAKHGQSPMKLSALNRIDDGTIINALNAAWNKDRQKSDPSAPALVAQGSDDDGMLLWLNDKSNGAAQYARNFLRKYNDASASVDGKPVISAGLTEVYAGAAAAHFIGVGPHDPRVPDVIGLAQYGVVYTGGKKKIAEHGGNNFEDRNVPILVALPAVQMPKVITAPVETTQIAPTILRLLGLDPNELKAVQVEGTEPLF